MNKFACLAALALLAGTTACKKVEQGKITDADAAAAADATQAAWTSMDVAKIEARYAKDVVGFDPMVAPMSTDWANWDKLQQGFATMKFDGMTVPDRKIQIVDADTFLVSGTGELTSKQGPLKSASMRFTNVYERQADGTWLIVNEHVSLTPKAGG